VATFGVMATTDAPEDRQNRSEDWSADPVDSEWTDAVNAMHPFFRPRSVAVIGASRERGTIGAEVLHNLLAYEFNGPVLPVNARASVVQSIIAYPTVEDVPGPVDLAVISVPRNAVQEVAVSAEGGELLAHGVAAEAGDEPAAGRGVVALVAADGARGELPLRVRARRPGDEEREDQDGGHREGA